MGEGPLTGAWPRLLALGGVLSSTPEEESSGVGDSLRKLRKRPQGRWEAEWEKQAREGGRPGELWCGAESWRGVQSDPEGEPWRGRAPSGKVWR